MSEYTYLKKCRGSCLKNKDVSQTSCIGINQGKKECYKRQRSDFEKSSCPYYIPLANEKNYTQDWDTVIGKNYYRKPFRILWFYTLLVFIIPTFFLIMQKGFRDSLFLLPIIIKGIICVAIITFLGNLFFKNKILVAIINEEGIYTRRLHIKWEDIIAVKTHYAIPTRFTMPPYLFGLEIILGSKESYLTEESSYIYFSTFEMRRDIRKYIKRNTR